MCTGLDGKEEMKTSHLDNRIQPTRHANLKLAKRRTIPKFGLTMCFFREKEGPLKRYCRESQWEI